MTSYAHSHKELKNSTRTVWQWVFLQQIFRTFIEAYQLDPNEAAIIVLSDTACLSPAIFIYLCMTYKFNLKPIGTNPWPLKLLNLFSILNMFFFAPNLSMYYTLDPDY